jgi:hypothetical protein
MKYDERHHVQQSEVMRHEICHNDAKKNYLIVRLSRGGDGSVKRSPPRSLVLRAGRAPKAKKGPTIRR